MKTVLLLLCSAMLMAQPPTRKLGGALNNPTVNYWAPFVCLDGNTMLFLSDYTEDGQPALLMATRTGVDWNEPFGVPKKVANPASFLKAFTLSPDGKTLFTTTRGALGGFDLASCAVSGKSFGEITAYGAPLNSTSNEGSPTLTPDGNTLYFMRCAKMTNTTADDCKIWVTKKKNNGTWDTPTELPANINSGNSQMPRILADGQTLLFASNKLPGGKGGLDFYITKQTDTGWTDPQPLTDMNTAGEDLFGNATMQGLYVLRDVAGQKKNELIEYLIPQALRPKAVCKVTGSVTGIADPTTCTVSLINIESRKTMFTLRPDAKGNFVAYVPEGDPYSLFIEPQLESNRYFSKVYDYRGKRIPAFDKITADLKPIASGETLELTSVQFVPESAEIEPKSIVELQKVARLIRGSTLNFTLEITLFGYAEDSVQRGEFTEPKPDTVVYQREVLIDSVTTEMQDSVAIEYIYHNDRTAKQATRVIDFLATLNVNPNRVTARYSAVPEAVADRRRITVRLVAR